MPASLRHGVDLRGAATTDAAGLATLLGAPPETMRRRLERLLADAATTVLVALDYDGALIGVAVLQTRPTLLEDTPVAVLSTLFVAAAERRRGIARLLLKAACQAGRSAGCEAVAMLAIEPPAQRFCATSGFTPEGQSYLRPLRRRRD